MTCPYAVTYKYNGIKPAGVKWDLDCDYGWTRFTTRREAEHWIKKHPEYTPYKLLEWDSEYQMNITLIDYRREAK